MREDVCILQVEDDENDVFLLDHAFKTAGIGNPIRIARDGQEAIDYLEGVGEFGDRTQSPIPGLIILDLKLPRRDGLDVLRWLRQESPMRSLPVIVFSSSAQREDIDMAYRLGANSFVVKPPSIDRRVEFARHIKDYWLAFHEPAARDCEPLGP